MKWASERTVWYRRPSPMKPLVRLALTLRRALSGAATTGAALGLGGLVVLDAASPLATPWAWALGLALAGLLGRAVARRGGSSERTIHTEIELGTLAIVVAYYAVLRADRSLDGEAHPIVFLALAAVSAFARPSAAVVALVVGVVLEAAVRVLAFGQPSVLAAAPNAAFMLIFTGFNAAVLRTELARLRSAGNSRVEQEIARVRDEARSFRLLGGPAPAAGPVSSAGASLASGPASTVDEEERLLRAGIEEIHQSVLFALRLVRESLGLSTTMLLWQNDAGTHLRISELVSDAPELVDGPFLAGDGVFGAALARGSVVSLSDLKPSYALPYYAGPCPVGSVCVLPVHEHGKLRGLLVADRADGRAFEAREEAMLEEAARFAVRAIQNERVFLQLERTKVEQSKLYRAADALGSAKSEGGVIEAGVRSAREITSVDYAALVLFDEATKQHEIRVISGDFDEGDGTATEGARFRSNAGLVSMALENRHPLPYRGAYDDRKQIVFTKTLSPPKMPSIFVLPLVAHEKALGTLVLGSRRRGAFGESVRRTLEVLASHMAVSLDGARMLERLEELATTDGLTGLLNKRAMLEMADQKIQAAKRFGRRLSVLVTDIDHFKKVNDTYGHDVGDVVIKGLGDILRRAKRQTDAVARFGGEEFVLVCEETDEQGAVLLAERVRQELERTTFVAPGANGEGQRSLKVTCSIGIAVYPEAGASWESLFKGADLALYASKQGGRNRVTVHAPGRSASAA